TGALDRIVPIHLIVKDQRLVAASDPQIELAARIKKNLTQWSETSTTGTIERTLRSVCTPLPPPFAPTGFVVHRAVAASGAFPLPPSVPLPRSAAIKSKNVLSPAISAMSALSIATALVPEQAPATSAPLTKIRLHFPEVIHNSILYVQEKAHIEVKLGDS